MSKVRVSFTVDVDLKAWASEYGVDPSDARDDVRNYVENALRSHLAELGLDG